MPDADEDRLYLMHLRAQHQRIGAGLDEIEAAFSRHPHQPLQDCRLAIGKRLGELRRDLAQHFFEEENGGCIEEALCRCPSLAPQAAVIKGEHSVLLDSLDDVIGQAAAATTRHQLEEVRARFARFAKLQRAHEAAENRVLQMAFTSELEGVEVDD